MKLKKLCDLRKSDIKENFAKIFKVVQSPLFLCVKCARVSNDEKHLCDYMDLRKQS